MAFRIFGAGAEMFNRLSDWCVCTRACGHSTFTPILVHICWFLY